MTKRIALFFGLILCTSIFLPYAKSASETGNLDVIVTQANNNKGVVRLALYNSADAYSADKHNTGDGAFRKAASELKNSTAQFTFRNLAFGQYAIKVYHDEDNSGKFYSGPFGIPKVQYGFSNNAKGLMGPASFNKAVFDFKKPQASMTIELSK